MERPSGVAIGLLGACSAAIIAALAALCPLAGHSTSAAYGLYFGLALIAGLYLGLALYTLVTRKGACPRVVTLVGTDSRGDDKRFLHQTWDIWNAREWPLDSLGLELRVRLLANGAAIPRTEWQDCFSHCDAKPSFIVEHPRVKRDFFNIAAVLDVREDKVLPGGDFVPVTFYWRADSLRAKTGSLLEKASGEGGLRLVWSFEWHLNTRGMSPQKGWWEAVLHESGGNGNWMESLETDGAHSEVNCRNRKHMVVKSCDLSSAAGNT